MLLFFRHPAHRRRLLLYAAGIGLQVLAYPDPDWGFLGWVLLWPYLLARRCDDGASWWRSALLFGFLRAYAGFYWLGNVHFTGWIAVSVLAALVFAFVFELTLRRLTVFPFALRVATGWLLFEGVHAWIFKGFPWLFLSHTQYRYPVVIQAADVVGAFGISFLMVYVQAAALDAWLKRRVGIETAGAAAALVAVLAYGVLAHRSRRAVRGRACSWSRPPFPHAVKAQDKKTGGKGDAPAPRGADPRGARRAPGDRADRLAGDDASDPLHRGGRPLPFLVVRAQGGATSSGVRSSTGSTPTTRRSATTAAGASTRWCWPTGPER